MTPDIAHASLRSVGLSYAPDEADVIVGDTRWAVVLPEDRIAWFPASDTGRRRLAVERRVLGLIGLRCSFAVPRLLFVSDNGFDIRRMVPGHIDPADLFNRCRDQPDFAATVGRFLGSSLAEQHSRIVKADVAGWLRQTVEWPRAGSWIRERLPRVVNDADLVRRMGEVIDRYEAVVVDASDFAMVHGDLGLHNLALEPAGEIVNGIFDYDEAAWADRHHDFRYLMFDPVLERILDAALAAYEPATGRTIDRQRLRLYNAACAICYVAYRDGTSPESLSCGRTLAEDLSWVGIALAALE